MTLCEYLIDVLESDGVIEEDAYTPEELTRELLLQETSLEDTDIDDLIREYEEYCTNEGAEPEMDL